MNMQDVRTGRRNRAGRQYAQEPGPWSHRCGTTTSSWRAWPWRPSRRSLGAALPSVSRHGPSRPYAPAGCALRGSPAVARVALPAHPSRCQPPAGRAHRGRSAATVPVVRMACLTILGHTPTVKVYARYRSRQGHSRPRYRPLRYFTLTGRPMRCVGTTRAESSDGRDASSASRRETRSSRPRSPSKVS